MRWLLLVMLALAVACGSPAEPAGAGASTGAQAQLWTCGMHPQVVQDHPGTCPICGMDLTPMGADRAAGVIEIDPGVVLNTGVRTAVVKPQTIFRHLRTVGEVDVAEDEVSVVNLRFSGWVEAIAVDRTGDPVKAGQKLFDIYSPELVAAQEELLLARRSSDDALAASARRRLELWDIAGADIDAVLRTGTASRTLPIRAPASGYVLHKGVVEGARVEAGHDLYRIGDLTRIWVNAEVYEFDAPWVAVGQPAQMELSFQQGEVLAGKVAYIQPTLNPKSRTLQVRLEFENPGVQLKPGMFATVWIQFRRKDDVLAVPTEAIIHSGERELVFVSLGEGRFAAREVRTGLSADHHLTEVVDGLSEGEEVVTSGQFLLDSESALQEAIAKLMATRAGGEAKALGASTTVWSCPMHPGVLSAEPGRCPTCGMFLEERIGTQLEVRHVHGPGEGVIEGPGAYTCPMHPDVQSDGPGRCPVCDMFLVPVEQVEQAREGDAADPPTPAPGG